MTTALKPVNQFLLVFDRSASDLDDSRDKQNDALDISNVAEMNVASMPASEEPLAAIDIAALVAEEREKWAREESSIFAKETVRAIGELAVALDERLWCALKFVFSKRAAQKLLNDFQMTVISALKEGSNTTIRVDGPRDLSLLCVEALRERGVNAIYGNSEGNEMRIVIDQTHIETALARWIDQIDSEGS